MDRNQKRMIAPVKIGIYYPEKGCVGVFLSQKGIVSAIRRRMDNPRSKRSISKQKRLASIIGVIIDEYNEMTKTDEHILSEHEGYAFFFEAVGVLWSETIKGRRKRNVVKLRKAAARIGAIAIRYINDITGLV